MVSQYIRYWMQEFRHCSHVLFSYIYVPIRLDDSEAAGIDHITFMDFNFFNAKYMISYSNNFK